MTEPYRNDDLRSAEISAEFTGEELSLLAEAIALDLMTVKISPEMRETYRTLQRKVEGILQSAKKILEEPSDELD